jgi:hypothetical protein
VALRLEVPASMVMPHALDCSHDEQRDKICTVVDAKDGVSAGMKTLGAQQCTAAFQAVDEP